MYENVHTNIPELRHSHQYAYVIHPHHGVTYCTIDTVAIYSPDDNQIIEILASRYVAATTAQSILDHKFIVFWCQSQCTTN
jgi:hypothetical protein